MFVTDTSLGINVETAVSDGKRGVRSDRRLHRTELRQWRSSAGCRVADGRWYRACSRPMSQVRHRLAADRVGRNRPKPADPDGRQKMGLCRNVDVGGLQDRLRQHDGDAAATDTRSFLVRLSAPGILLSAGGLSERRRLLSIRDRQRELTAGGGGGPAGSDFHHSQFIATGPGRRPRGQPRS